MAGTTLTDPEFMKAYRPSDFYSGAMAPPTSVNGILHPTPTVQPLGNVGTGNHIYGEATDLTPAELAKIVNGDFDNIGYTGATFNAPGGKTGKLPTFQADDRVSAYTRDPNGDLTALTAIAGMDGGSVGMPRRDPRGYGPTVPGKPATGDPWATLRGPGTSLTSIPGMITGARPVSSGAVKAASIFAPVMAKPITYTPAPFNYAAPTGSPNASFEKDHGTGSLTQSMMNSSRWNTGY
jgi:hypothetical protein